MNRETVKVTSELAGADFDFNTLLDVELVPEEELKKAPVIDKALMKEENLDALQIFMRDVGTYKLLTPEEEYITATKALTGDKRAKDIMVQSNLRLVIAIAKNYRKTDGAPFLDLIQDGTLGLMKAIERYDPTKGFKFSTYATWWIRQSITRGIADTSRTIRMPVHIVEKFNKIVKTKRELFDELNRDPSLDEIANRTGFTLEEMDKILSMAKTPASLDRPISDGEEENEFKDYIVDSNSPPVEDEVFENLRNELLDEVLDTLSFRERKIIELRFGLEGKNPKTLEDIGRAFNITKERVRQIEVVCLEKVRKLAQAQSLRDF